ncbi:uncharacterized protein RCC_10829 [Ramularia collo-cygni]|uniref:Uncharacterized protein n=1 Tax=Ramularia collo-cygni TaxID=112498 RepID=A0A2D3VDE0_9PEZI|nr:uncharacterized protein RCC_10829 [Ramularia collo-cygni]CZT25100.1 uncharacterized protein RCC_10829 [Ramularia collo-cygni]
MPPITIRPPTFSPAKAPAGYQNPTIPWLSETWHVTHSTLPMWKSKKNVRIQYTPMEPSAPSIPKDQTDRIDDLVTYQSADATTDKISSIRGIDKAAVGDSRGEWDWRGKGWLMIASSHWEVLAWGEEGGSGNKYVVTMFAKTLFTPAGIDVYSQNSAGVAAETLESIKEGLATVDDDVVKKTAVELFEIKRDDTRKD